MATGHDETTRRWWPGRPNPEVLADYWSAANTPDPADPADPASPPAPNADTAGLAASGGVVVPLMASRGLQRGDLVEGLGTPGPALGEVAQMTGGELDTAGPPVELEHAAAGTDVERRRPRPVALPDEVDGDELPEPAREVEGSAAVRVRGWAGRGPVGLVSVKPPKWVKARAAARSGPGWGLARLATGGEWDGHQRTDATWWRFGTEAYEWSDRLPARWWSYPRVFRMAGRWATASAATGVGWGFMEYPTPTAWGSGSVGGLVLGSCGWAAADSLASWGHRRRRVWPLHRALVRELGYPKRTPPRRYLYVPKDYRRPGAQVEIALPPGFVSDGSDERGKRIANIVRRKLALGEVDELWRVDGDSHFLVLRATQRRPVPAWVRFSTPAVREQVAELAGAELFLGQSTGGETVKFSLDTESPHALLMLGSGGGKSEMLKSIGAQLMHSGAEIWIFDHKYTSHDGWVGALERAGLVRVFRSTEEIHRGLVALGRECHRRNEAARAASAAGKPPPVFRRLGVLVDEWAITSMLLRLWWSTRRRELDGTDPETLRLYGNPAWTKSPAEVGMFAGLSMGRQRLVHMIVVSQITNANEMGGSAVRNMFQMRVLGRQPMAGWRMAAPEVDSPPICSRHLGRVYPVIEGQVHETQGLYFTDAEAADWALAGQPATYDRTNRREGREVAHTFASRADAREVASGGEGARAIEAQEAPVSLKAASSDRGAGVVPYRHQYLRNLSVNEAAFPAPTRRSRRPGDPHLYDPDELRQWHAARTAHKTEV